MRIVFMGTPAFAIPSLDILLKNKYDVVGVITSTDKWGGRNNTQLLESDIKKYAMTKGLRILQPSNLKSEKFIDELRSLKADLQIVVAFRMLPEVVFSMPEHGTYNLHGSLLPKFRGAAPINWAIIRGEKVTGVTSFKLQKQIDTGDIFLQEKIDIKPDETAGELHDRMKELAAQVILKTVNNIEKGTVELTRQSESEATSAPKLFRENGRINWNENTETIYNLIRGVSPYPGAWTELHNKMLKIRKARPITNIQLPIPGNISTDQKTFLRMECIDGAIDFLEIQMQGKQKMDIRSFLNGYKIK